jgi:hypothetical protein
MATYLADRVIVYDGQPSVKAHANTPESLLSGMNRFLKDLEITFRRDPGNFRPRINKYDSVKDKEQKVFKRLNCSLVAIISSWKAKLKIKSRVKIFEKWNIFSIAVSLPKALPSHRQSPAMAHYL